MIKDILLGQLKQNKVNGWFLMGIQAYIKNNSEEAVTETALKVFNALGYALENSGVFVASSPDLEPSIPNPQFYEDGPVTYLALEN